MGNQEQFWDKIAGKADDTDKPLGETAQAIVAAAKTVLKPDMTVIDYGCGWGGMTVEIAPSVRTVHAVDISGNMLALAKQKAALREVGNIAFHHGDLSAVPLEPATADALLAFNVLHLVDDSAQTLAQIAALLRPGGLLIASTACIRERWSLMRIATRALMVTRILPHMNRFDIAGYERLIANAGFEIMQSTSLTALPDQLVVARKT
ncbi:class I SAM-dependent methyltransferase [Cucumibacter marinus]|uniref:class I SAM-dependent methyltransferase n=1 Tax=Cucumibacter marinus TaxID=1121252 RepID=UPI00040B7206|nr:class I SAM-dependent methyltransferase [Cucumibacter marinus]